MKHSYLLIVLSIFLYSCNKDNENIKQEIIKDSTELITIENNIYFPIDTLTSYVYKTSTSTFDDTGTEGWTTTIYYDTLNFQKIDTINNTEYTYFDGLKFTTTENTISIITNLYDSTTALQNLVIAYTNCKDTTWSRYISKGSYIGKFYIEQTYNDTTNEFTIKIPCADVFYVLYQEYRFKKNKGLIYKAAQGGNITTYTELIN
jgi:hypothetical protein